MGLNQIKEQVQEQQRQLDALRLEVDKLRALVHELIVKVERKTAKKSDKPE